MSTTNQPRYHGKNVKQTFTRPPTIHEEVAYLARRQEMIFRCLGRMGQTTDPVVSDALHRLKCELEGLRK